MKFYKLNKFEIYFIHTFCLDNKYDIKFRGRTCKI